MGRFSKLFFNSDNDENTLHDRTSLTDEQLSEAKQKKDALLGYLKSDLSATLDVDVRHWLQGSYKSHTLIRPVKKKQEFDIDVGIYLMCNAEDEDLQAGQIKSLNRQVLSWYAAENALQLEPSKSKCERITFPQSFHLDIPIYYKDEDANICKLATDNGWIDSDPQAFQNWFQETVSDYEASELARLRRVIRYFKTWNCLCVNRGKFAGFSSIAITVLVATYYGIAAEDDDAFINTVSNINTNLNRDPRVTSPINGDDLLNLDGEELRKLLSGLNELNEICQRISKSEDIFQNHIYWNLIFEHVFPPYILEQEPGLVGLPAVTTVPEINVRHLSIKDSLIDSAVMESVTAYKGEHLRFSINNRDAYPPDSRVNWIVRNQGAAAKNINDLGHIQTLDLDSIDHENCEYAGVHILECQVIQNFRIVGFGTLKVTIHGYARPVRNPPKKAIFKGF